MAECEFLVQTQPSGNFVSPRGFVKGGKFPGRIPDAGPSSFSKALGQSKCVIDHVCSHCFRKGDGLLFRCLRACRFNTWEVVGSSLELPFLHRSV
jgi:hypothetical protein